jgi:hypothetical protein
MSTYGFQRARAFGPRVARAAARDRCPAARARVIALRALARARVARALALVALARVLIPNAIRSSLLALRNLFARNAAHATSIQKLCQ